jgi:sugar phosphate permease
VSKWFNKKRGRATGIATTGIGLGGLFLAPFAGYMMPILGWRGVYVVLALLLLALVTPVVAWIIKSSPEEKGLLPDGEEKKADNAPSSNPSANQASAAAPKGITLSRALQSPTYWLIAGTNFLASATIFGTLAHQTSYIESIGISRQAASLALGFTAGMGILGKIFFGFLAERMSVRFTTVICLAIQAVGVVILIMTTSMMTVWLFVIVFGFSMGGMATLRPLLIIEFFGTSAIGAILGSMAVVFSLGAASGPITAAYIYDFFQSYYWAFFIYVVAYGAAVFMISITPALKVRHPGSF